MMIYKSTREQRTRSGGPNGPMTANEIGVADGMSKVFKIQFALAKKRDIVNTMQFDWVASPEMADEIYRFTHGHMAVEANTAGILAGKQVGVQLTDFIDRPNVTQALMDETYNFAASVGKSTQRQLARTLAIGQAKGETYAQLTKRVQTVFGITDPDRAVNWRANRIARTEIQHAITIGEVQGWKQTGVVQAEIWKTAGSGCPFCQKMNGQQVGLGEDFFKNGDELTVDFKGEKITLMFNYSDIKGPPLHCFCRCDLEPVLLDIYQP